MSSTNNERLLPVPEKFRITENFGELIIEFDWHRVSGYIFLVFSLIWNGILVFMLSKIPSTFAPALTIHAGVGIYLFYHGLSSIINKTVITCTNDELIVKSGPLPAFGNKKINKSDISQLYFTEKVSRTKNGTTITYSLYMLDVNNVAKRIIKNLPNTEAALFIESKVEKFFKIKNIEVIGEYRK
jgi:hypothetical protein